MAFPLGNNATGPAPPNYWDTAVLESFIPGYSIASRILATYFHLDLSFYIPMIVAGAIGMATVKYSSSWIKELFKDYFVSTAEIRLDDEIYTYIMFWMTRQPFTTRSTRFLAGTKIKAVGRYYYDSDDESDHEDDDEDEDIGDDEKSFDEYWARMVYRDKFKRLRFTPSEGTHYFRYKGRVVAFTREREDRSSYSVERVYLSCAGRNPTILKELLADAQRLYIARDGNRTVIYRGQKNGIEYWDWMRCMARPPRPLSTVVLDAAQKQAFVDDIKEYLHPRTKRWYSNRGIPYRRGYLLHGPPGTGKTSLCFAASGLLGLTLYLLNLNSRNLDEDSLMSLFQELPRRCIVLLEDVDTAGITKKREESDSSPEKSPDKKPSAPSTTAPPNSDDPKDDEKPSAGLSLSALLNVIDGVAASEGRILVMTTNHADKLDAALLRPGRVDMTVTFGYAEEADIKELFSAIYSTLEGDLGGREPNPKALQNGTSPAVDTDTVREKQTQARALAESQARVAKLSSEFASRVPAGELSAAEIQGYLLNHKNAPEDAIEGADEWVKSVRKKKEERKI